MTTIGAFLGVIAVLILVHELGHFLVARCFRVRVTTFSLGFGPKLFARRFGDTEYCLRLIPLGGYVRMNGEASGEGRCNPDDFAAKPRWQRCLILAAGPVANVVFAVMVVAAIVLVRGVDVPRVAGADEVTQAVGAPASTVRLRPGVIQTGVLTVQVVLQTGHGILNAIGGVVSGDISPRQLMGPVGMAQLVGASAQASWLSLVDIMVLLSLNLAICNLLPVPVLDGGQMVMLMMEGVIGRDLSKPVRRAVMRAGLVCLILLMLTALLNDLGRLGVMAMI
jgi:regulator of sigma E protease